MYSTRKIAAILLKTITILAAVIGIVLSAMAGRDSFMGGGSVFMYFTIQSNILIALICAWGLRYCAGGSTPGRRWQLLKLVGAVSITLTGVVFCFVLAPTMGPYAWNMQNILTHVVVPAAAVADFFVTGRPDVLKPRDCLYVVIPPILYAVYAGVGYVCNWQFAEGINYPYFFLNWGSPAGAIGFTAEFPFMGCVWWILALLLFLLAVGRGYLAVLSRIGKAW